MSIKKTILKEIDNRLKDADKLYKERCLEIDDEAKKKKANLFGEMVSDFLKVLSGDK